MEDFDIDKNNEKFKSGVWKKVVKEFGYFKELLVPGVLLGGLTGALDVVQPKMTKYVIDTFVKGRDLSNFNAVIAFTGVFLLISAAATFLFIKFVGHLEIKMCHRLRTKCFTKLQSLSLSFYDKNAVGWLMSRMSSDINKLSGIVAWGVTDLFWGFCMMMTVIVAMFGDSPRLALIGLMTLPIIVIFSIYLRGKILKAQRRVRKINSQLTASYNEDIQGAKTTKTLVREELNAKEFVSKTEEMKTASIKGILISSVLMPTVQLIGAVGTALMVIYGGMSVVSGAITIGLLVAFFSYVTQFNAPLAEAADLFAEFISAQAAAERIFGLLEEESEIKDKEEVIKKYGTTLCPTDEKRPSINGGVKFEDVSFWYKEGEPVLSGFDLEVEAGQTIALVGATGAGKSTIVNLFCRFYEPKSGRILVDGIDYTDMGESWIHENLGYVLQSPHLFSGTIAENIRYGKLDASDEEIIEAAKLVDAHDFIVKMEKGYDTEVGEGGSLLSTGQKQLISFARTLVRNPRLFVLDEATSSIDTETEQKIQKAITTVLSGRTSFVVAHRLSTIRNADKIIVVEGGKMIECGNHEELMKKKGHYYELYTNQFISEEQRSLNIKS
ncbi:MULTISPECIES: ABC transporter ATP-binding protein [unclassified Treponema]|uniref:ABC transporter ATP-binding protein n=1 Tax=unclassified Treponema TaxID=2638727 RepID=UPI0020A250A4|nr:MULTISPECIES: ABC transporter ATP-binding protein [unclassified Treponema]UTC67104.1 ABC transporter ATP-binding protein [Treponema sp. OMZ 789]UTC69835.1 ABC transporter ATP-binding protein [Treponema sp. OMZ 790]UTC72549.1 ABC transporter ATP-binding protein [Treponema sp. OMZ 791]